MVEFQMVVEGKTNVIEVNAGGNRTLISVRI